VCSSDLITLDNVEQVIAAGAQRVAVCATVTKAIDPADACRRLKERIVETLNERS
jgi:thiamine monophosphate synthase